MAINKGAAYLAAFNLVKEGMQGGTIKLYGTGHQEDAAANGKADAAYLGALLTDLQAAIEKLGD